MAGGKTRTLGPRPNRGGEEEDEGGGQEEGTGQRASGAAGGPWAGQHPVGVQEVLRGAPERGSQQAAVLLTV